MKTIPIPVQVPDWAKWVAQDEDGHLVAFERKPRSSGGLRMWTAKSGASEGLCKFDPNPNWRETLREVE